MTDERQILNLLHTYAEKLDKGDLEGVARLFSRAEMTEPSHSSNSYGYEAVLAIYKNATRLYPGDGTPRTKHVTTNTILEIDDNGAAATARSYFTVFQATDQLPLQPIITGSYTDEFRKTDGQWHFHRREMAPDLYGDLSQHLLFDPETIK